MIRTYRPTLFLLVFGLIFAGAGASLFASGLLHWISGEPMMTRTNHGPLHVATNGELALFTFFPLIHFTVGVFVLLYWKNTRVILDNDGIRVTNTFGNETFRAEWKELDGIRPIYGKGGTSYRISADFQSTTLAPSLTNWADLKQRIRENAPQLDFPNGF